MISVIVHLMASVNTSLVSPDCDPTEKCEGGDLVKADELLPAMEEEVLQTQRTDPLLCQRLQGTRVCETVRNCFSFYYKVFDLLISRRCRRQAARKGLLTFVLLALSLLFLMKWTSQTPAWLRPAPRTLTTASQ